MQPVNNVERITFLLREKLAERARSSGAGAVRPNNRQTDAPSSVAAMAAADQVNDRQFRRAVIQAILLSQFGRDIINDAGFQQIVEQVCATIESDDDARALLDSAAKELRSR